MRKSRTGTVQPGEDKAQGDLAIQQYLKGGWKGTRLLSVGTERTRGKKHKLEQRKTSGNVQLL